MCFLLVTSGSHGDIHPFIAIARALVARGHRALLATNPYFHAQIDGCGIEFAGLGEHADLGTVIRESPVMDPWRGPLTVMRLTTPMVPGFVRRTRELIRELRPDALVYHPIVIGAPWAAELEGGVPTVSIAPSPVIWSTPGDPLVLLPFRSVRPSPRAVSFDRSVGKWFLRLVLDPGLNRIRRSLGLAKSRDIFLHDATSADLNLGIWSSALRGPLPADPTNSMITGFTWHDRDHTQEAADSELRRFLDAGSPPIVLALGSTGVHVSGRFYDDAVAAARALGMRALMVVGRGRPTPSSMPVDGSMLAVQYAPFSTIFARAAIIVHHGGAGTTAQAMRAGRPMLVTPMAHDQFDNAARITRLGAGNSLRFAKVTTARLVDALTSIMGDTTCAARAEQLARVVGAEDGAARAAEAIETVRR